MTTYKIIRFYRDHPEKRRIIARGLTLEEARAHCHDSQTGSATCTGAEGKPRTAKYDPWFDGYDEE
jgi:hypothetical protein